MDNKFIAYLKLLEEKKSHRTIKKLREYISRDPEISRADGGDDKLKLADEVHITFRSESSIETRLFFDWWARTFKRMNNETIDELTGVYTRSCWERKLKYKFRDSDNYLVAMADIDHFKRFNDIYGHQTGDKVLAATGEIIKNMTPDSVQIIRYGGEEFLFVFPNFTLEETRVILQKIRGHLERKLLYDKQPEQITLSIGLSEQQTANGEPEQKIRRADLALYEAKRNGRNQLAVYAPYLNREDGYYVWGIYRYFRGKNRRIFLGRQNLLINREQEIFLYDWSSNSSKKLPVPEEFKLPINGAVPYKNGYLVIDSCGDIFRLQPRQNIKKLSNSQTPTIVKLIGEQHNIFGVGVNNQLYRVENKISHWKSLPEQWQFISALKEGTIYLLVGNRLVQVGNENKSYPLPAEPSYLTAGSKSIYLTGCCGRGFRFDPLLEGWSKLELINIKTNTIHGKKIMATGRRLLIRDMAGRLLFCRRKGKSVAQEMNLFVG